jgi:hypothetical protein
MFGAPLLYLTSHRSRQLFESIIIDIMARRPQGQPTVILYHSATFHRPGERVSR